VRALLQDDKPNMESLTVVGRYQPLRRVSKDSPAAEILEGCTSAAQVGHDSL